MEHNAYEDVQFQEQGHSTPSRVVLWLRELMHQATGGTAVEMSTNGNSTDLAEQQSDEPMATSSTLDSVAKSAVNQALIEDRKDAHNRPGSGIGRIFPSLIGSPARSDPGSYLWDPRLRASPDSEAYKQARREMVNPPAVLSRKDRKIIRLVSALTPHREEQD